MIILYIISGLCIISILFTQYVYKYRNNLTYRIRIKALEDDHKENIKNNNSFINYPRCNSLPSYNKMMWMLFTFKYEDFISGRNTVKVRIKNLLNKINYHLQKGN